MQGILYTGLAAVRDQMRRTGVFNPLDAGEDVDQETGELAPAPSDDGSRKRSRAAAMAMLAQPAPHMAFGSPGGGVGGPAPHVGTDFPGGGAPFAVVGGGAGAAAAAAAGPHMGVMPLGGGAQIPRTDAFVDQYAVLKSSLRDMLAKQDVWDLVWGDMGLVGAEGGLDADATPTEDRRTGAALNAVCRQRVQAHMLHINGALGENAEAQRYSQVWDSVIADTYGGDRPAPPEPRMPHGVTSPHVQARFYERGMYEVAAGVFLSGAMALHLARWPGFFSLGDESVHKLVQLVSCNEDVDFLIHARSLQKSIDDTNENDLLEHYALAVAASYQTILVQFSALGDAMSGAMAKATLAQVRADAAVWWNDADGPARDAFMEMDFSAWMGGLFDLLTPYRKAESLVGMDIAGSPKVFRDVHHFYEEVLDAVRIDVVRLTGYSREILGKDERYHLYRQAQSLDYYYACMVRGAAVKVGIDRVWTSGQPPAPELLGDAKFVDIMWKVVQKLQPEWALPGNIRKLGVYRPGDDRRQIVSAVQHMRDVRDAMVEVWTESRTFRVSDEVHMVEVQVLQRLKRDGLIAWFDSPSGTKLSTLHVCNWFRRHESVRDQFATTVGKRMATESLVATHNQSIMSHQRTVNWAEREYMALHQKVCDLGPDIASSCCVADEAEADIRKLEVEYHDYAGLLHGNAHRDRGEAAVYAASRGARKPR
mmetsp:Transcript_66441/g.163800  ORF Transcript_66441/g.163800 Transcript_66441/m.163800 type:complete len:707 (+) Transcript_66441:129-2249(+)